ncbi:MAG: hypothetical protein JXA08_07370 [Methanomicrobiaceae archaeon]|nr:hypothetical protein [Methanomicrobiaceae archaeon]
MLRVKDFPIDTRWQIATRAFSRMIIAEGKQAQDRTTIPDTFYELADEIRWIAQDYDMPRGDASGIVQTLGIISNVLFGPRFETPYIQGFSDEAVIRITRCPLYSEEFWASASPDIIHAACSAYLESIINSLNPEFTLTQPRSRCSGDKFCEMVIKRKME